LDFTLKICRGLLCSVVAESDENIENDDVFVLYLRDLWHKQCAVDLHSESSVLSLYDQLQQLEHAKQSQQSLTQVAFKYCTFVTVFTPLYEFVVITVRCSNDSIVFSIITKFFFLFRWNHCSLFHEILHECEKNALQLSG